ncbi:toll-like receptor 12 [Engraulis encrasicolus]|uniref:toll-like receptor 12 n=1 Tax=Engraulis encrasicolus TaxID=184585 RepID=UPI002FD3D7E4
MKLFCCRLAVFLALLVCWPTVHIGWAWISQKCLMLDVMTSYSHFAVTLKCPWYGLTAACDQVTNVSLDLSRIPRGMETICLTGKEGLVLQPNAFSRFQHLIRLYIDGGVAAILPGAFRGLSTLHALSLASPNQIHLALTSEVFQDLTGLEELTVTNYALAAMTTNVFARLGQLRSLEVTSDDVDFSAVVCRLLRVNATLTNLQMTMVNMTLLKTPDCLANLSAFPLLQNVSLVLPNITTIETGALQCFKRITNICVPLEEPIMAPLLQSGIQSIDSMDISLRDLNVESLCEIVLSFAVTKLAVTCLTLRAQPNLAWAKCQSLQSISLQLERPSGSVISLSFIHALRNVTWLVVDAGDGSVLNLSALFGKFPHHLTEVSISVSLHPINFIVTDDSTPDLNLTLNLIGKSIGLFGCDRPFIKSVTKLMVTTDSFTCGGHGSSSSSAFQHFSSVEWLKIVQWTRSTVQDLSGLSGLVHLRELGFQNVNLDNSTGFTTALRNLTRLEKLSLEECWLDSLQASTSMNLQSLKFLELLIDGSNGVTESFFEPLTSLKLVILGQQHLRCDCESARFEEWARRQSDVEVFLSHYQQESLQCEVGGKSQDLRSFGEKHCRPYLGFMLFVITATLNLLFILVVLLQHLAREYLLALFHIAGGWVNEALRHHDGPRGRYDYDAFVSYSGRDERWVVDRLLPALEQRGPPLLRLCLHSRDFQPGKDVVQNITDSLYRSRRTLCLVSRHFLRSGWCSLEMRLATQRLQVEHRDVLILVFLEAVPSHLLSAHHRLARLVKTRTYIQWPQEPVQQEAFWDRLWAKLASERR